MADSTPSTASSDQFAHQVEICRGHKEIRASEKFQHETEGINNHVTFLELYFSDIIKHWIKYITEGKKKYPMFLFVSCEVTFNANSFCFHNTQMTFRSLRASHSSIYKHGLPPY
jgi:hypothetical protein